MIHKVQKPLRAVVQAAIARGCWTIEEKPRGRGHTLRLRHTSGLMVPLHGTKVVNSRAPTQLRTQLARIERSLL